MPESFDPYYRWLGIPPKDQPANHYRLLGIDLFESNPEVIRDGAGTADGTRADLPVGAALCAVADDPQRTGRGAAKASLIDPERKTDTTPSFVRRDAAQPKPPPPSCPAPDGAACASGAGKAVERRRFRPRQVDHADARRWLVVGGVGALAVVLVVAIWAATSSRDRGDAGPQVSAEEAQEEMTNNSTDDSREAGADPRQGRRSRRRIGEGPRVVG